MIHRFPIFLSLCFALAIIPRPYCQAQTNLVPNPSFEELLETSDGHLDIDKVAHWFNPHRGGVPYPYATPDCMTVIEGNHTDLHFRPYRGQSVVGLITYLGRIYNFREYITVRLDSAMTIGEYYDVSFLLTNGANKTFGAIGTDGLGFLLSTYPPIQKSHEPLTAFPQYSMSKIFYHKGWKHIQQRIVADSAYRYLTFGNFSNDYTTQLRYYRADDIDPQGYYFIDDVDLHWVPKPTPKPIPKPSPIIEDIVPVANTSSPKPPKLAPPPPPPSTVKGRAVYRQGRITLLGDDSVLTMKIKDSKGVDGDIVSVQLNGQWIIKDHYLKKRKHKVRFTLQPNTANYLVLFANSMGASPPCTASFQFKSKTVNKTIILKSSLGRCAAVEILVH